MAKDRGRWQRDRPSAMTTGDPASLVTHRVGERLKRLREARELSLEKLGTELGVNWHRLAKYEQGKREAPYWLLIRLAEHYGVGVEFLLLGPKPEQKAHGATPRFQKR